MRRLGRGTAWSAGCLVALGTLCGVARSQDSFDDKPAARNPAPAPARTPTSPTVAPKADPTPAAPAQTGAPPLPKALPSSTVAEAQDFGVPPTSALRPTAQLHAPTPTTIPGGKVVATRQLEQWMQGQQGQQGKVMLLHAIGSAAHLPNAIPAMPASQGGSFDDVVQRDFGDYLQKATAGDRARLIVTYCQGVQCWGSYNAALRAIRLGYTNVHWYRGGMEAWQQAGLPILDASTTPAPRR